MELKLLPFIVATGSILVRALDLDSIFDEVQTVDRDFKMTMRIVSQRVFAKDDAQAVQDVREVLISTTRALNAVSDKIGSESSIEDGGDVLLAFCDDMEVFTKDQQNAADVLTYKAQNIRESTDEGANAAADVTNLSSAYDRYARAILPLTAHCPSDRMSGIYEVKATLLKAAIDINNPPSKR